MVQYVLDDGVPEECLVNNCKYCLSLLLRLPSKGNWTCIPLTLMTIYRMFEMVLPTVNALS